MASIHTILLVFSMQVVLAELTEVSVQTDIGTFIGFSEEVDLGDKNVTFSKFLGIPFGEPPIGDLRFRKPVEKRPLAVPLKVQTFGSSCMQLKALMPTNKNSSSEDCLFLNIVRPETGISQMKLPVMVWIYGGSFTAGQADDYIGDALAANGPVIYVSFNYRVTAWGFLSTEDSNAPGNYGLWDQHLAITWVHKNIKAFGGDPSRVTIFGQSAGAGSVVFQGLYQGSQGLFQRIIAQSGTAAANWAIRRNPSADAKQLAGYVDCEQNNTKEMMGCLRAVSVDKINDALNDLTKWDFSTPMPFVPSVDDDFVRGMPTDNLDMNNPNGEAVRKVFSSFELMIGQNSGEGGAAISPMTGADTDAENFLPNKTFFDTHLVPFVTKMLYGSDVPSVVDDLVVAEYTDWQDPENPERIRQQFCDVWGDSSTLANTYRTIKAHASASEGRSYMYYFDVLLYKSVMARQSWFTRALHGDDLSLVFANKLDIEIIGSIEKREFQDWERQAAEHVMTLWTNFAKTGNPNRPRDLGVDWLAYTPSRRRYLEISNAVTSSKVKERLQERRAELWDSILPSVVRTAKPGATATNRPTSGHGTSQQPVTSRTTPGHDVNDASVASANSVMYLILFLIVFMI